MTHPVRAAEGPIVLTGASGFIARHVAHLLLAGGHAVRATLRDPSRAGSVREAVLAGLPAEAGARLTFVAADLERDEGWAEAMDGASALIHTASPFPMAMPRDRNALIGPAVAGTRRVIGAALAAGVDRVVLTSSVVAMGTPGTAGPFGPDSWTDAASPAATAYDRSKTLAERAAWEAMEAAGRRADLAVINPGLVLGPLLGRDPGTSLGLVQRILRGRDPFQLPVAFAPVDVRDVALAHLEALRQAGGERVPAVAGPLLTMAEMAEILAGATGRRLARREAPRALVRLMGLASPAIGGLASRLGWRQELPSARFRALIGREPIPPAEALTAAARSLIGAGLA